VLREARARKPKAGPQFDLAKTKWASSGLSDTHASDLKFKPLSPDETKALGGNFAATEALLLPYFDLNGKQTEFYRVRYLGTLPGFAGLAEKPQRYAQPAGTLNEVYLPPILPTPWREVARDVNVTIHITEGELKAAAACAMGLATIGLGGVDVWRASKKGIDLLPALAEIEWKNRQVVIVYDSDAATNPNVVRAQNQLSRMLLSKGAMISIASLPPTSTGEKQGLDDLLLAQGEDALLKILQDAPAYQEASALWEMNQEVVYVQNPGIVIARDTGHRMDPGSFVAHHYSNRHYMEIVQGKNGGVSFKRKPLARRWMEWEHRYEVGGITYAPGKPQIHDGRWNAWGGWGCEPKKGDVGPYLWLLEFLFKNDRSMMEWFLKWAAYPLQNPGAKLYTAMLLWGVEKGTGKTGAYYGLRGIYGKNFIEIKNKDLKGGFNAWAANRQFVYGDEITGKEARVDSEWLKGLITQLEVRINEKFMPEYVIPDTMNYGFSSNNPDALFLEDGDRRYAVHEVVGKPAERAFYEQFDQWLKGSGPSHLFQYLLDLDLGDFNPRESAPETASKRNMTMAGKSDLGAWCVALREDPHHTLRPLGDRIAKECELFTPGQLLHAYGADKKVTAPGMARELVRAGFRQTNAGSPVWTKNGAQRIYAIRNPDKWQSAAPKELAAHFDKHFGPDAGKF